VDFAKPSRVGSFIGANKVMIWVYFWSSGIGNTVLLRPKETFNREFCVEKFLGDFDEEWARNHPRKCSKGTFLHLDNATPHRHRGILIASESQDFLIRHTARISHHATSDYPRR
jgi:hypothetical protein